MLLPAARRCNDVVFFLASTVGGDHGTAGAAAAGPPTGGAGVSTEKYSSLLEELLAVLLCSLYPRRPPALLLRAAFLAACRRTQQELSACRLSLTPPPLFFRALWPQARSRWCNPSSSRSTAALLVSPNSRRWNKRMPPHAEQPPLGLYLVHTALERAGDDLVLCSVKQGTQSKFKPLDSADS